MVTTALPTPALYDTTIRHVRRTPLRHGFTVRSYWWLVDVDAPPVLPSLLRPFVRFDEQDHLGGEGSLRERVEALLAGEGITLRGRGRFLLLANARVLGHTFNPLSVWWCLHDDGEVAATVAEVHNTYGGRHAYVLRADESGRASVAKAFYVSPFHPVDGRYDLRLPLPGEHLGIAVSLHRPEGLPFVATVTGSRRRADALGVVRVLLRHPFVTLGVALRIRLHGIWLWLRRLPVVPRPAAPRPAVPAEVPTR